MWQIALTAGLLALSAPFALAEPHPRTELPALELDCAMEIERIERAMILDPNVSNYNRGKADQYLLEGRNLCLADESDDAMRSLALAKLYLKTIGRGQD